MAAVLGLALGFAVLPLRHAEARSLLAQPPTLAPAPAAHSSSNDAEPATSSLPSSAYVTVTVVGTAVLMVVAGLAAYQYRRRKRLELERRARLEREALEQLEQQRRLARLAKAAIEPVAVFIPPIVLNPDASVHLGAAAHCGEQHSSAHRCSGASGGCACCSAAPHGRRMLVRPGQSAFARVSLQRHSASAGCEGLQLDGGSLGSSCGDDESCGSDAGGSCDGQCGWEAGSSSDASIGPACGQCVQQSMAKATWQHAAEQQRGALGAASMAEQAEEARNAEEADAMSAACAVQPGAGTLARAGSCPASLDSSTETD